MSLVQLVCGEPAGSDEEGLVERWAGGAGGALGGKARFRARVRVRIWVAPY